MTSSGPANKATVRVLRGNSCGSGTICGRDDNGSYVLTNAHVNGSDLGGKSVFEVESLGRTRFTGRTVRAAYNSRTQADWNLSFVEGLTEVEPVYLDHRLPFDGESFYTKGFPRCQPMNSGNVESVRILQNGVMLWLPNAIGGQSGSGVISDDTHTIIALLTWSMAPDGRMWYGGGQLCNEIWKQNRAFTLGETYVPKPKIDGWEYVERSCPVNEEDRDILVSFGCDIPPVLNEGVFGEPVQRRFGSIQEYPIWAHMFEGEKPPSDEDANGKLRIAIEAMKKSRDTLEEAIKNAELGSTTVIDPEDDGLTFGL